MSWPGCRRRTRSTLPVGRRWPPRLREPGEAPVTCWTWSAGDPAGGLHLGRPPAGDPPVALAGADGAGEALDAAAVGAGGAVRAVTPGLPPGAGMLWVVAATGVVSGVADAASAAAIGI